MKHLSVKLLPLSLCCLTIASCNGESNRKSIKTIDIASHISESQCDNLSANLTVEEVITPEFTDSTIISLPHRIIVTDDKILIREIKSRGSLMAFDAKSGKALEVLNHSGEGPEEYQNIIGWGLSSNERWAVLDMKKSILEYSFDGKFLNRHANDTINTLWSLAYDRWVGRTNIMGSALYAVVYDSNWETVASIPTGKIWSDAERKEQFNSQEIYDFLNNDHYYLLHSDSIFKLDETSMTLLPTIALEMGKYSVPEFTSGDEWVQMSMSDQLDNNYIRLSMAPVFNDRYLFITYHHKGFMYFDAYDMNADKLLFRGMANEDHQVYGMPVRLPQGDVRGWPFYAKDNKFYFMIPDFEAEPILENDETNPPIVVITIE